MNDRIDELLALAALGELTEAEELELDAALAADATIADELDADLAVAAALQTTQPITPPTTLRDDVLAAIANVEQDAPDTAHSSTTARGPVDRTSALRDQFDDQFDDDSEPVSRPRLGRGGRWMPFLAAAAVAVLFAGGVAVITGGDDDVRSPIEEVALAPDAVTRVLDGELGRALTVTFSPSEDALVVLGTDVPELSDDETYQLWLVDDAGGAQSVGLFRPDESGSVEQRFDDRDPRDLELGVTVERASGSETPTLPIVAST
ncbi:MAG: anti-sigma factor [Ilumatobacter sp.]|jgi:hypothetical protein|uniref:anti-sigma factor n=1 Tax=Ilumatobacter sp. TaxID=1967498 RepID=UPI00391D1651